MNRILVFVVILLVPIAIITSNDQEDDHIIEKDQGNISLEIPISSEENENKEETYQVMLSDNSDKSDAFAMDLEDYIIGVVAGEMPASFSLEALKAQAVASRTFALYKMESNKDYVLSTTINDQVYLTQDDMKNKWGNDYEYYYNRVKEAVLDTEGEVLTYNGKLASTYYFAISNGYTDDALTVFQEDRDYLVSVESPWDKDYQSYTSLYTMNKSDFCSKLEITCGDIQVSQVNRADNHYVREVTINGKTFTGIQVFQKLNLKSTDFTITSKGDTVEIQTLGFGHGVGMSQYGANGLAAENKTYKEILNYYYKNIDIKNV